MKTTVARTTGFVLILLGLVMMAYAGYLVLSPNIYRATVRVKAEKDPADIESLHMSDTTFDPYWVQSEFEKIQSKSILYPVITNLNLNKRWAERRKQLRDLRTDETYALLKASSEVRQSRGTSLIEISVTSEDKQEASEIANAIADEYRQNRLDLKREMALKAMGTYTNELNRQNAAIAALEVQAGKASTITNDTQRKLATMKDARDRLQKRIEQETSPLLERNSVVNIIDRAEPSLDPIYPGKLKLVFFASGMLSTVLGATLLRTFRKS